MIIDIASQPGLTAPIATFRNEAGTLVDTENGTLVDTNVYRFNPTLTAGYYRIYITDGGVPQSFGAVRVVSDSEYYLGDSISGLKDIQLRATQASVAAISFTGSGARTVTITVTDGTNPLASALVRVTSGVNSFTQLTNVSGVVTFNLDDGIWIVAITKGGYSYAGSSITVDGTETRTLAMTAISFPSSPTGQTTGYWYIYDEDGDLDPGAKVDVSTANTPKGSTGLALQDNVRQLTADGNGLLAVPNLFPGTTYKVHRQNSTREFIIQIPSNAQSPVALGSIVG